MTVLILIRYLKFEKNYFIDTEIFLTENVRRLWRDIFLSVSQPLKSVTVLQNMSVITKRDQTLLTFFFMHKFVSKIQKTFSISFVFLSTLYEKKSKTSVH